MSVETGEHPKAIRDAGWFPVIGTDKDVVTEYGVVNQLFMEALLKFHTDDSHSWHYEKGRLGGLMLVMSSSLRRAILEHLGRIVREGVVLSWIVPDGDS